VERRTRRHPTGRIRRDRGPGTQIPQRSTTCHTLVRMVEMSDGRSARRARNRDAVLDALVALTTEGRDEPSIDDIADRAGVSYRSVYRYFKDRSEMMDAATDRAMAWIQPLLLNASGPVSPGDPLDYRIDSIVDARVEVYFQIADMLRNAMVQSFSNRKINDILTNARRLSRHQIEDRFHEELKAFSEGERQVRITSMDQVLSFMALDYVISERSHTREELERYLRGAVRAALTVPEVGT
jgi:TetR/AcrR family transcriptional regulator of autoinduction and epiphytic fitness